MFVYRGGKKIVFFCTIFPIFPSTRFLCTIFFNVINVCVCIFVNVWVALESRRRDMGKVKKKGKSLRDSKKKRNQHEIK